MDALDVHEPDVANRELIELAHEPALVDLLEELDEQGGGRIDLDTSMGPGSLRGNLAGIPRCSGCRGKSVGRRLGRRLSFVCARPDITHGPGSRWASV